MRYAFLLWADEAAVNALPARQRRAIFEQHVVFGADIAERGGLGLGPLDDSPAARTLRPGGMVTDGPFAESKEQIGGIYVVECADPADAEKLARRIPDAPGQHIEIRPILDG